MTSFKKYLTPAIVIAVFAFVPALSRAATLSIDPAGGSFVAESTFNVSIFLDTEKEEVNAVDFGLIFPADKLQIVSPSTGFSVVSSWVHQPSFNNQLGRISFQGVMPSGIYAEKGLIATVTFRAKSLGRAVLKFTDNSAVILNDGKGTDVLKGTTNGIYDLVLPPPAGPAVISETHPDPNKWYANANAGLQWQSNQPVEGYSYILNHDPVDIPDDISEGARTGVVYKNLSDGIWYFHIKSLSSGAWGGTTHYQFKIDTTPPAGFEVGVIPEERMIRRQPVLEFSTTDALSGVDHYEIKVVPLNVVAQANAQSGDQNMFFEVQSPYSSPPLELGDYDAIVRAYDKAGNFVESVKRFSIVTALFQNIGEKGLLFKSWLTIPWVWLWGLGGLLVVLLGYLGWRLERRHKEVDLQRASKELPSHVRQQLDELKKYRNRYGKMAVILLAAASFLVLSGVVSAEQANLVPPLVTTASRDISNNEIFYVGGKTEAVDSEVVVYFQNVQTGEVMSETVRSDKKGDWFYRHGTFLTTGNYILWAQTRIGGEVSPPSPQVQISVRQTAIQFGASRVSYETLYLIFIIILLVVLISLGTYTFYHGYHARKKRKLFMKEVHEAEESVRRGFAVLRRDIQAELGLVKKIKFNKELSREERTREEQLLRDLAWVEKYIGKEVWDIEQGGPDES